MAGVHQLIMRLTEGEVIIFGVVRVTSHGRVAHVNDATFIIMVVYVNQFC